MRYDDELCAHAPLVPASRWIPVVCCSLNIFSLPSLHRPVDKTHQCYLLCCHGSKRTFSVFLASSWLSSTCVWYWYDASECCRDTCPSLPPLRGRLFKITFKTIFEQGHWQRQVRRRLTGKPGGKRVDGLDSGRRWHLKSTSPRNYTRNKAI